MMKWLVMSLSKWLKRHFVPHVDNAYRPHFLFGHNIRQLLGVVLGFELMLFVLPTLYFTDFIGSLNLSAVLPGVLSSLTNEERVGMNLSTLSENPLLTQAAQLKAEDMASKGYFAHTSPDGKTPWYWLSLTGYHYSSAGENLAVNFSDSHEVTRAWMNSPTHRANIVAGQYTEMGTGIANGIYKGQETIFVAQVYASPVVTVTAEAPQKNMPSFSTEDSRPIPVASVRDVVSEELPPTSTQVLGESEQSASPEPTFVKKSLASPHQAANAVLYVTLSIVMVALFLNIAIKFDTQHPDLITNGLVAAVIIFAVYITNSYIAERNLETSFIAFAAEETLE